MSAHSTTQHSAPSPHRIRRIRCRPSIWTIQRFLPSPSTSTRIPGNDSPDAHATARAAVRACRAGGVGAGARHHAQLMARPRVVAIVGPTATGKSALAIALAHRFNGEVVSCDSTAVYRQFDIGTDKVPLAARQGVPHHLIDVADPTEDYSAARDDREAAGAGRDISARRTHARHAGG